MLSTYEISELATILAESEEGMRNGGNERNCTTEK